MKKKVVHHGKMPFLNIVILCNDESNSALNIGGRDPRTTILFQHAETSASIRLRTRILRALRLSASAAIDSSHLRGMWIDIPEYSSPAILRVRALNMSNKLKGFDIREVKRVRLNRWVIRIYHPP